MRALLFCFSCLMALTSVAQSTFEKILTKGTVEHGWSVIQTGDGGYAVLATSMPVYPETDWWLIKTDSSGDTLWSRTFQGSGDNNKADRALVQTADGGFLMMIDRNGKINLLHVSANGDSLWEKELCSGSGSSISPASGNRFVISGRDMTDSQAKVALADSAGTLIWEKHYQLTTAGSGGSSCGWAVREVPGGGFIIAGSVTNIFFINRPFLLRINPAGDSLWFRNYWYQWYMEDATAYSVDTAGSSGFYAGVSTANIGQHAMVMKFDDQGDTLWTRVIDQSDQQMFLSVRTTGNGGVMACGYDRKSIFGDSTRVLLVKFSSSGDILTENHFGNYETAMGASVEHTTDDGFIICGDAQQTATSKTHCLLIKTDSKGNISGMKDQNGTAGLKVKPNPASDRVFITAGMQDVSVERRVTLHDVFGREQNSMILLPGTTSGSMDLSAVPDGFYVAVLRSSGKVVGRTNIIVKR